MGYMLFAHNIFSLFLYSMYLWRRNERHRNGMWCWTVLPLILSSIPVKPLTICEVYILSLLRDEHTRLETLVYKALVLSNARGKELNLPENDRSLLIIL